MKIPPPSNAAGGATQNSADTAMRDTHLIVFAKAPVPGQVKTRLAPAIGAAAAARLAERMLVETLDRATAANPCGIELCCAPDEHHPALARAAARAGATLSRQAGADLGARMAAALQRALREHRHALLIGTDCPALDAAILRSAATALADGHDAVFAPALDGGYGLIGLARMDAAVFHDIPWSTSRVMAETERRLAALGWKWRALAPLQDVDDPRDLAHVPEAWYA